jgi:hypothetical protein
MNQVGVMLDVFRSCLKEEKVSLALESVLNLDLIRGRWEVALAGCFKEAN